MGKYFNHFREGKIRTKKVKHNQSHDQKKCKMRSIFNHETGKDKIMIISRSSKSVKISVPSVP